MEKYAYLFELDSVRKTDEEILAGQQALYNEIVTNGNIVVLTYNQFVDSRGFFSLLDDPDYYKNLLALFESGAIRISQYGNIRTIAQYILNTIDAQDNQFIYSALPLKYNQKRLTALVHRSLTYSDLSELYSYLSGQESEEALRDLFLECEGDRLSPCQADIAQMREILQNLYWLLSLVLRLSTMHNIYIPPKPLADYEHYRFIHILNVVLSFSPAENTLWAPACRCIRSLPCFGNNSRSPYLRQLKAVADAHPEQLVSCQYAEAILDLCYNYSNENSVCNISKHYNVCELDEGVTYHPTFQADFFARLEQAWDNGHNAGKKYLQEETNVFEKFQALDTLPDFSRAVHVAEYVDFQKAVSGSQVPRYEYELDKQRRRLKQGVTKQLRRRLRAFLQCILLVMALALADQIFQSVVTGDFSFIASLRSVLIFGAETIAFLCLSEFISGQISKRHPKFLSLSEAVQGIGDLFADAASVLFSKAEPYANPCPQALDRTEKRSHPRPIDYYESQELKSYRLWQQSHPELMAESDIYPIADVNDPDVIRQLMRLEELFHYRFGIAYKSRYNTMVVDPIAGGKQGYFPYDRAVPTAGKDGVVAVAMYQGRFILLRQYRHAIRQEQYSFPRGYAEPEDTPEENARRELREELHAVIEKEPVFLGRIAADSGLTSCQAYVYLVELAALEPSVGHEGIINHVAVTPTELKAWIQDKKITDGFTLGAFALYEAREH